MDKVTVNKIIAHNSEFELNHPHYCRTCHGWGVIGSGLMDRDTGIPDRDACPVCSDNNLCPWCGAETLNEDFSACTDPACGYECHKGGIVELDEYEEPDIPDLNDDIGELLQDLGMLDHDSDDPLGRFGGDFDRYHDTNAEHNRRVARGY